ncbi:hypothetical protein FRC11_012720 [Ceratobasidium sp. 423]|nr:hypothetical protein FRC11_012720 [Ceratobasidium sp. 423]
MGIVHISSREPNKYCVDRGDVAGWAKWQASLDTFGQEDAKVEAIGAAEDKQAAECKEAEEQSIAKQRRSELNAQEKTRQVEERERVDALQAQAEAELETAPATVRMMHDVGDLPGLVADDPNYDLLRKIAHLTGKNYVGQGLTTEELQDTLDDPMADTPGDEGNTEPGQPSFAAFYPGLTFGSTPKSTAKSKPTSGA